MPRSGFSDEDLDLLGSAHIGMLAMNTGGLPLVNPVAYHYGAGSVWMTTSRSAVKVGLLHRDPRAGFLVGSGGRYLLLQGKLDEYDPRSISDQVRAAFNGPAFYLSLAGYAVKNAAFIGGYMVDAVRIPAQWWPQNRVVLRLRPQRALWMAMGSAPKPGPAELAGVPRALQQELGAVGVGYLCWTPEGLPNLAPALWSVDGGDVLVAFAPGALDKPRTPVAAALVVERHHRFRATRMQGACVRGHLEVDPAATARVAERFGLQAGDLSRGFRLRPSRVTWWKGFEVATVARSPSSGS